MPKIQTEGIPSVFPWLKKIEQGDQVSMEEQLVTLSTGLLKPKKVWKDECAFSFSTPESSKDGLFLNLTTFQAFSKEFLKMDVERTGNILYMNIRWTREEDKSKKQKLDDEENTPTKLAIGVEGGFSSADVVSSGKIVRHYGLCIHPDIENIIPYPSDFKLPANLVTILDEVIALDDASHEVEVAAWNAESEPRIISKFADNLVQLDNAIKISPDPKTWKCQDSGMTENLWLNLSTGYIGSGRRTWDGSGGTGAALKHFEETGSKYPLCVKLGTITADGKADVYSYDPSEDCMVEDPLLAKHLSHFGINILDLKKTEKSMLEVEIELNQNAGVFSQVLEENEKLEECYGPSCVGLFNLGNSCYCNTVYQVLMSLPAFQDHFLYGGSAIIRNQRGDVFYQSPPEPQSDLFTQFVKLSAALSDPSHSNVLPADDGVVAVSPGRIRDVLANGHIDFSGREQQDAKEYFAHVIDKIQRMDHARGVQSPSLLFTFSLEQRLQCMQSKMVRYSESKHNILSLKVPIFDSSTGNELPVFSFDDCLKLSLGQTEVISDYMSPATGQKGTAQSTTLIRTFPKYLAIEIKRYIVGENWVPQKLDCKVQVPQNIDLTDYLGKGLQNGEALLPEDNKQTSMEPDSLLLSQLVSMGFHENGCKRALLAVRNAGMEEATQWVLEHMSDTDFEKPLEPESKQADPEMVTMLESMGFSREACALALTKCDSNLERAADWLFSHSDEIDNLLASEQSNTDQSSDSSSNHHSSGKYSLRGFISHLGKSTTGGHYLCHINVSKEITKPKWVLFNDRKVALSKKPPLEFGYLYIFERDN